MATYYGTYGQKVQYLASDPSDPQIGQVWYNSTSAVLKVRSATTTGTWATGGNLPTALGEMGSAGISTAALTFGGDTAGGPTTDVSFSYNGTAWTTTPNINNSRSGGFGCGTQTSALLIGGYLQPANTAVLTTELWNGTSWTNIPGGDIPASPFSGQRGGGTTSSAFLVGGRNITTGSATNGTSSFNGSTWTSSTNYPQNIHTGGSAFGSNSSGLYWGGGTADGAPNYQSTSNSWNGSAWTSAGSTPATVLPGGSAGTQTAALGFGGSSTPSNTTIGTTMLYNGTSWTTNPTGLSTAKFSMSKGGSSGADALSIGGRTPSYITATEEWTGPGVAETKTVTVS